MGLSEKTIDTSISIIITSPSGKKILINCGEGTQRLFLDGEHKLNKVNRICLTELNTNTISGLGGMILTSADSSEENGLGNNLDIYGPKNIGIFINSLKYFIRRDNMNVIVREAIHDNNENKTIRIDKWSDPFIALGN